MIEIKVGKYHVIIVKTHGDKYFVKRGIVALDGYNTPEVWHKKCQTLAVHYASGETIWATAEYVGYDERQACFSYDQAVLAANTIVKTSHDLDVEREDKAWVLRQEGHTYKQIGEMLNVKDHKANKMANKGQARSNSLVIRNLNADENAAWAAELLAFELNKAKALLEQHGYNVIQKPA